MTEEKSAYCDYCQRPILARRDGVNHLLHFFITFFTFGLWAFVWIMTTISQGDFACPNCGSKARVTA